MECMHAIDATVYTEIKPISAFINSKGYTRNLGLINVLRDLPLFMTAFFGNRAINMHVFVHIV